MKEMTCTQFEDLSDEDAVTLDFHGTQDQEGLVSLCRSDPGCYSIDEGRGHLITDTSLQIFETLPSIMRSGVLSNSEIYHQNKLSFLPFSTSYTNHKYIPNMASTPHHALSVVPNSPKSDTSSEKSSRRNSQTSSSLAKPISMSSDDPSPVITGHGFQAVPQMGTGGKNSSNSRRSSVKSQARIRVEKLEEALKHIGIEPTLDQQLELRSRLSVELDGSVSYGEFVAVARELFKKELQERNVLMGSSAKQQRTDVLRQQALQEVQLEENSRIRAERDRALAELEDVKIQLREKDKHCNKLETDLLLLKTETKEALQENKSLKKKVHLSEQAQKAARSLEQDYEDVVKLLESENEQLRASLHKHGESGDTSKRVASLTAELRKAELNVKTYEVATEKLLHFVNVVANNITVPQTISHENKMSDIGGSQTSSLQRNKPRHTQHSLVQEARDVTKLVKSLIEHDPIR